MEYTPPPLFKQGASARLKVIVFAMIAIVLLVVDARLNALAVIRQAVGTVLYPLQMAALVPRDVTFAVADYFTSVSTLERENEQLRRQQVQNGQMVQQGAYLQAENAHLRQLLMASEQLPVKSVMSEILYDTRDAYTRKIVLDRGTQHKVERGQPVIDDSGVVGQVTRVFPFTSEVTLLTDKDQAISVQVVRSGVRSVAYGRGQSGVLDLRFMAANADVQKGDVLVTSGLDGVYPAGLAVATVLTVERSSTDAFARIVCQPVAGVNRNKQLLILLAENRLPPRPEPEETGKKGKGKKRPSDSAAAGSTPAAVSSAANAAAPATGVTTTTTAAPAGAATAATANAAATVPAASAASAARGAAATPVATPARSPVQPAVQSAAPTRPPAQLAAQGTAQAQAAPRNGALRLKESTP